MNGCYIQNYYRDREYEFCKIKEEQKEIMKTFKEKFCTKDPSFKINFNFD